MSGLIESHGSTIAGTAHSYVAVWNGSDAVANSSLRSSLIEGEARPRPVVRIRARSKPSEAVMEAICRARDLAALSRGWNSCDAHRVSDQAITGSIQFLLGAALDIPTLVAPSVVPTVRGGVQLEWHRAGMDMEIGFEAGIPASWYAEDRETGESREALVAGQRDRILRWLRRASR